MVAKVVLLKHIALATGPVSLLAPQSPTSHVMYLFSPPTTSIRHSALEGKTKKKSVAAEKQCPRVVVITEAGEGWRPRG